ncbi:MAG: hypothetical protein U0R52_00190 [Solirubrobacterales bacterium]
MLGIAVGLVLGVGIVAGFVFLGSEGTIDAPRIDVGGKPQGATGGAPPVARGSRGGGAGRQRSRGGGAPRRPVPVIRVIGGAPPESGPVRLVYRRGQRVRLKVVSDAPVGVEIPGYGVERTVSEKALISFIASRAGQFPVVVVPSMIGIASLRVRD